MDKTKSIAKLIIGVVILILAIITIFSTFYTINEGVRGVVVRFGEVNRVVDPGFHAKIPFIEDTRQFGVRTQKYEVESESASSDLQNVKTTVAVQFFVNPEKVAELFSQYGVYYRERVIHPAVQEVVKASTAKYNASELITKRQEVKEMIVEGMKERMEQVNITLENVDITNFQFSDAFSNAIEEKVKTQQEALREKNRLEKVKFQAQQEIEKAKGEAMRIRLESQALRDSPELLEKMRIEMQLKAVEKWSGNLPQTMIPGTTLPFINVK